MKSMLLFAIILFVLSGPLTPEISEPRIFEPGIISTGDQDSHPAFSPDGSAIYFVKMAPDFSKWTLFVSYFKNGQWSQPEIAPFSGKFWDADPCFTKDGETLYFIPTVLSKKGIRKKVIWTFGKFKK